MAEVQIEPVLLAHFAEDGVAWWEVALVEALDGCTEAGEAFIEGGRGVAVGACGGAGEFGAGLGGAGDEFILDDRAEEFDEPGQWGGFVGLVDGFDPPSEVGEGLAGGPVAKGLEFAGA